MKAKYWVLIIVGFIIRVILAFTTFHPDIRAFQFGGGLIANGHILDLYDYLSTLPKNSEVVRIFSTDLFIYPPAVYLVQGFFNFIFSNILNLTVINDFLIENKNSFYNPSFSLHLFLLKFPYLIFDLIAGIYLIKLFDSQKQKIWALTLWIFNPVNLYATYMMGQFDLIATTFTIIALYYLLKRKVNLGALFLGIGIAFKIYPLFLLIPFVLTVRKWRQRFLLLIIGLIPYFLTVLPYINSHGFRSSALLAGQTMKSLYAQIPISGGESLLLFLLFLGFSYLYFYYFQKPTRFWQQSLIILLIFYIFTHFHPQWFIWVTPFLIIDLVKSKFKTLPLTLLMLGSYLVSLFFFNSSQTLGLFAPLNPNLYESKTIWEILSIKIDLNFMRSLIQTIFALGATFLIYLHLTNKTNFND